MFTILQGVGKYNICYLLMFFLILRGDSFALDGPSPPDSSVTVVRLIFSLILVFIIFYIIVIFLRLFLVKKGPGGNKKHLHLLDVIHPGPNLSLYLLESRGKTILIASNTNHITTVQETDITEDEEKIINDMNEYQIPGEYAFKKIVNKLFQKGDGNNEKN